MPTGKQTVAQFGATVKAKHPEYADLPDDQVGSKVLAKYPEYGDMVDSGPDPTKPLAHPFASPAAGAADIINAGPTTRTGTLIEGMESNPAGRHVQVRGPRSLLQNVGAGAGDAVTGAYHEFDDKGSFNDPTAGMTPEQKLQYHADTVADQGERQTKAFAKDPVGAYASHVGEQLPGLILGGAVHAAAPVVAEGAASTLNAGGRLLRKTGATASKLAVGAPAAIDSLGADAGAALSRNRIVAASKPSLLRKTQAKVGPAAEARDTILRNSIAAPVDVTPLTQAPFDEISDVKTDPKTGVVNPQGMSKANLMRRAVQEVADPQTGAPTGTPKDLTLAPHEIGELQRNMYDATDYDSADSDLANQYLKGTGAKLKGAIDVAVPEARTATQNVHDLLGAKEHLKATAPGPIKASDFAPGKILGKVYDAARVGGGTLAGAGLDVAGSGLQKAGGALRSLVSADSPVAPSAPTGQPPRRTPLLEANTPTDAPGAGPEDLEGTPASPQRPSVTTPPPVKPRGLLTSGPEYAYHATSADRIPGIAENGLLTHRPGEYTDQSIWPDGSTSKRNYFSNNPNTAIIFAPADGKPSLLRTPRTPGIKQERYTGDLFSNRTIPGHQMEAPIPGGWAPIADKSINQPANSHPGVPGPGARTRIAPSPVAPDPGPISTPRRLIAQPDGGIAPEPYPLGPGAPAPPQLESRTGPRAPSARPSLLRQFRREAEGAAVGNAVDSELATRTSQEKLAQTPEALPNIDPKDVEEGDYSVHEPFEMYHGTTGTLAKAIQKTGIQANEPQLGEWLPKGAYMSPDPNFASQYAHMRARDFLPGVDEDFAPVKESDTPTLVKVKIPRKTLLRKDPDVAHLGPEDQGYDSVYHPGPIPSEAVVGTSKLPHLRSLKEMDKLASQPPTRLPDPTDIDGWERLVDEGRARYNTSTHQYDYTGPITRRKLTR